MGKRQAPPKSFNTVRHSNRVRRQKRRQFSRIVLLAILGVLALLILSLMIFGICAFVNAITDSDPATNPDGSGTGFSPVIYQNITQSADGLDRGALILINDTHYFDPTHATGLKNISENRPIVDGFYKPYGLVNDQWKLNESALNALNEMMLHYYDISAGDTSIVVGSAYRTAAEQDDLPSSSVRPGYSDHHSGYCLTLKYKESQLESTHWIYENAHKYGFIVRYPEDKAAITGVSGYGWCLRYVGVAHATYMYQNHLCLEEYVALLQSNYAGGNTLKITDANGASHEVYYVAKTDDVTTIRVPKNYRYTLSGDNERGYIVTVHLAEPLEANA